MNRVPSCCWSQTSELEDLLEDLQNGGQQQQQQLCVGHPPARGPSSSSSSVQLSSSVDKQSDISDFLQMTNSSSTSPHNRHRGFPPAGESELVHCPLCFCFDSTKSLKSHKSNKKTISSSHQALMVPGWPSPVEVLLQPGVCLWTTAWSLAPQGRSLPSTGTLAPTPYCSSSKAWWELTQAWQIQVRSHRTTSLLPACWRYAASAHISSTSILTDAS